MSYVPERDREKHRLASARYRERNKKLCSKRSVESQKKNREYYNAKARAWQIAHREEILPRRRELEKQPRYLEYKARKESERRRLINSTVPLSPAYQAEIDGIYLFCKIFKGWEVDHIIPLKHKRVCGLHVPTNLQVLSVAANRSKGNKWQGNA